MKKTYHAIGLMSGSSLDGLDIAYCRFGTEWRDGVFTIPYWELLEAETVPFDDDWKSLLMQVPDRVTVGEFVHIHVLLGQFMGEQVMQFLKEKKIEPAGVDFIASHGHTAFHEPSQSFTSQIGDGASLAAITGRTVICDFRSADLAHGGQGAPLAPMADKMLFPGYDFYLNIGGIANITCNAAGHFIAFDVTGANQLLDALATLAGKMFDEDGALAAWGQTDNLLFEKLNVPPYFGEPWPKSLSNQWVSSNLTALCLRAKSPVEDRLHTVCQHIAHQIGASMRQIVEAEHFTKEKYRMLVTGGGAFNGFLMKCIGEHCPRVELVVPSGEIVAFKEACLMALLGLLRLENVPNCISSVTGADVDVVGGAVYWGSGHV